MLRYGALIAVAAFAAVPAQAQQMNAREARAFVVGKLFSYQCFEGTRGTGRIMENGAVAGTIQFRGNGATRYAVLPANTLHVVGDRVCASVKGVHGVRYQVRDVARSVSFYTDRLGFTLEHQHLPAFASVALGDAQILLSGPGASGSRAVVMV